MQDKIGWDRYESALLLEACERVSSGENRVKIIKDLSSKLRNRLTHNGCKIDVLFRNENGVLLQMKKMEYLLFDGKQGLAGAGRNFKEIIEIRNTSPSDYHKILVEAKKQTACEGGSKNRMKNNKESFKDWVLAQEKTKLPPGIIFSVLEESSDFAIQQGLSKRNFWSIYDSEQFVSLYQKLSNNKTFKTIKNYTARKLDEVYIYYKNYLDSILENSEEIERLNDISSANLTKTTFDEIAEEDSGAYSIVYESLKRLSDEISYGVSVLAIQRDVGGKLPKIKMILDNAPWAKKTGQTYRFVEFDDKNVSKETPEKGILTIDFKGDLELAFTKPCSFTYYGEKSEDITSWTELYVRLFSLIYIEHKKRFNLLSSAFENGVSFSNKQNGRADLGDYIQSKLMRAPKQLTTDENAFLETNLNAKNIVEKIRFVLNLCKIPYEKVTINYVIKEPHFQSDTNGVVCSEIIKSKKNEPSIQTEIMITACSEKTTSTLKNEKNKLSKSWEQEPIAKGFGEWLQIRGMSKSEISGYVSAISIAENFAKQNNIYGVYLTSEDTNLVLASIEVLLLNKSFIEYNKQQHYIFSAAFRKLRDYFSEIERQDTQKISDKDLELENPVLYHKLYSASKVFDDPRGLTVDYISDIIGAICSKEELIGFLDRSSWTTKLSEELYTFAQNITPVVNEQEPVIEENIETEPADFDKDAFIRVLMSRFTSGMQFDSIDLENFRDTYSLMFDVDLSFTDEELEKRLKYCGVIYQDRLFPAEGIIDNNTKERLFSYIDNKFAAGNKVLYYKAIFTDLSDSFVYCFSLTDEHMLRAYIEFMSDGNFYFYDDYMSIEKDVEIDHSSEIVAFMLNAGKPLSYDEVYEGLSHISKDIIYNEIRSNTKFLMNEREHYFHIDIFEFSEADGAAIAEILNIEIENNGYVIWSQIFETVKEKLPIFIENNYYLSSLGIRNALSRFMSEQFNFSSDVISSSGVSLGMVEVYRLFAKNNAPFSDTDLYNFSKITDPVINFWSVAQETVRVSKTLFVAKNEVNFDIEAVDKALETYLTSGYILVKDVDSFLVFPNVGYEWNMFLLENFLLHYSKKFCLVNNGTSLNNVAGAIAKKDGEFTQFVDICAHALAESGIELKKTEALNYLADINLITRRSYRDIELAMNKARQIRNRKG